MKARSRGQSWRPSHATVVSYIALFLALATGGAWAAATIGPNDIQNNAVRTRHIKNGAVTTQKIAQGAVKTGRIGDGAVTGPKVAADALTGDNIDESTLGTVPDAASASTAFNASALGGVAASGYQRACQGGAIAGHVYVKGSSSFPSTYTSGAPRVLDTFNCTGASTPVQVKRVGVGSYYIDFPGLTQGANNRLLVAMGNVTVDASGNQDDNDVLTYKFVFDNAINKTVFKVHTSAGGNGMLEDREFSFTLLS